jgi:flagellin
MPSVINTNVSSLLSQNSLSKNSTALQNSMERLSTGVRINSAKDDAAGLAITTRMTSEIRGLNAAVRNANDGISVAQTAEGSLGEITNILQRLRELAVQSANSSNNSTDRSFLDTEAQQLIAETNRIGAQTNFNGIKLLNGSFSSQNFQVGAGEGEVIAFNSISDSRASALGSHTLSTAGTKMGRALATSVADFAAAVNAVAVADTNQGFKLQTAQGGTSSTILFDEHSGADVIAAAINTAANASGITATAKNSATLNTFSTAGTVAFKLKGGTGTAVDIAATITTTSDLSALAAAINGATATTGITASFASSSDKSSLTLDTSDGRNISIQDFLIAGTDTNKAKISGVDIGGTAGGSKDSNVVTGTVDMVSSKGQITTTNGHATVMLTGSALSTFNSVASVSLTSQSGSSSALSVIDQALTQVNNTRSALGGLMNRFAATVSNQGTTIANLAASRSRIMDTDYAVETTNLAKAQIIQQAATAMLAQANQSSQSVLALLK